MRMLGIVLGCLGLSVSVFAHVKREQGFFYTYIQHKAALVEGKKKEVIFERDEKGSVTQLVGMIKTLQAFDHFVLKRSYQQPVVVKLCSSHNADSIKIKPIFQEVAQELLPKVGFFSVDVLESNQLFVQIMAMCHLDVATLPLFLFFKDGHLYVPAHAPAPIVQGYVTKENLLDFVKRKFELP